VKGFSAFAAAGIPPGLGAERRAGVADDLGGEILDFEEAFFELLRFEEIARASVADGGGLGGGW